jgi:exonuclease SbcD
MIKILHFADAHIDIAGHGRHDPETGLPVRVVDFLNSLDEIIDTAITEKVDLVLFAGDAYKDRTPVPTFQREWGRRIMRLSNAGITTLLLTGNHDISASASRAHAIQEFDTLEVPKVHVVNQPALLKPEDLDGVPVMIIALPWVTRSGLMATQNVNTDNPLNVLEELEAALTEFVGTCIQELDPQLPAILTAHASIEGASYGNERTIMLGKDVVLPLGLVKDPNLDYVALGHIHKAQNLNPDAHPPVIYSGSIERVDFGEAQDNKYFVIAEIEKGQTRVYWHQLKNIRTFIDLQITLENDQDVNKKLQDLLQSKGSLQDAIVRLQIDYHRELEKIIDETSLRNLAASAFEFHLVKHPRIGSRVRLPGDREMSSYSPQELLEYYWKSIHLSQNARDNLTKLSKQIIDNVESGHFE